MKTSTLRYRLLQFLPLIVVALMAAAWFSLPVDARHQGISPLYMAVLAPEEEPAPDLREVRTLVMDSLLRQDKGLEPWEDLPGIADARAIDGLAGRTSTLLAGIEPDVCDETGAPRVLTAAEQEQVFASVGTFEERYKASVTVFVVSTDLAPTVALSSIGDARVLTDEERAAAQGIGTVEALRRLAQNQKAGPVWLDLESTRSGISGDVVHGGRHIGWNTLLLDGHFWESYTISREGSYLGPLTNGMWDSLSDPELKRSADVIANSGDGAVLVVGPMDSGLHVVRPAPGMDAEQAARLWSRLSDWRLSEALWGPISLGSEARAVADGAGLAEVAFAGSGAAPRIALVALYRAHPREPALWEALGRSPLTVLRVWLGTYLSLVIAALAVLFLASLVASPLAFRAERIYRERVEAERERERVQREAELRVVRKLDELSERVESVREHASEATSASVSDVAEDIDSTVAELRRILGDVVAKGDPDE
jgi:hypothetical protein